MTLPARCDGHPSFPHVKATLVPWDWDTVAMRTAFGSDATRYSARSHLFLNAAAGPCSGGNGLGRARAAPQLGRGRQPLFGVDSLNVSRFRGFIAPRSRARLPLPFRSEEPLNCVDHALAPSPARRRGPVHTLSAYQATAWCPMPRSAVFLALLSNF